MKRLLLLVSALALVATASSVGSAAAAVVTCKTKVYKNGPVVVTSASGISCAAAAREQRRYAWTGKNTFTTPGGYRCRPSGRGKVGYQIRCVLVSETQAPRAYRIEFAD
jgi:hypothetical protein